jgi:hypothetical protein
MRKRRDGQVFNLSFLDVVSCGFGAIILLLVLTKSSEVMVLEEVSLELESVVAELEERLQEIRGEARVYNAHLSDARAQLSEERDKLARLQQNLTLIQGQFANTRADSRVQNTLSGKLSAARQELTEEMESLLGKAYRRRPSDSTVGGIPVDSEYIIFIIDTSGSMQDYAWPMVQTKLEETLKIYPRVKGIQVMNDMGEYMFSQYAGRWIPDSPARRQAIVRGLRGWRVFSNSSPVEGIEAAIRRFYAPDKKISLYVFGDEFSGGSIERVVNEVDRINRPDAQGNRRVRIHAVGFPTQFIRPYGLQTTGIRFAALMRELCWRNGGTFVGISGAGP